ncbi:MAG: hypothetical protein KME08_16820 [Aphanothece sp. CMT-3BRIN-NPC111]|nr:hypothetical protein [Aphanothece sp. CMT-3BRIN-NPC111]
MESSGPSAKSSDQPAHRWAEVFGTVIAILTLTLPLFAIANFSSSSSLLLQQTTYSVPRAGN